MIDEGVIKFQSEHQFTELSPARYGALCCKLVAWREVMAKTQLVGQDPARYGGAGYGNISGRVGAPSVPRGARSMLISGSQTSGLPAISLTHFAVVQRYDYRRNQVASLGQTEPSSESMTHGAIYDLSPAIRFVMHAHSPTIWHRAQQLRIPITDPKVAYGTAEMALDVQRLWVGSPLSQTKIFAMGGHEDGVVVFGYTIEEAGQVLITNLARAYELMCRVG